MDAVDTLLAEIADKPLDDQFDALKAFYAVYPELTTDPRMQAFHLEHHEELHDWAKRRGVA